MTVTISRLYDSYPDAEKAVRGSGGRRRPSLRYKHRR